MTILAQRLNIKYLILLYLFDVYTLFMYNLNVIRNFKDKEAELIYNGFYSKKLPNTIQKMALRKLIMIDNAKDVNDLKVPPGNHLEQLKGNRLGQYSIRINDQYRICFIFKDNDFYNIEIIDYH